MTFHIDDASRSGRIAVVDAVTNRPWTFGELVEAVTRCQAELPAVKQLIFVFCRNQMESLVWFLAAFNSGHAVALLDEALNPDLKANLIAQYQPELIASNGSPTAGHQRVSEQNLWRRIEPSAGSLHPDLGLLLSTSGTTGSPKFVRLTRRNVEVNAEAICEALAIAADDRAVAYLPLHYSYGFSIVTTHLLAGASFLLTEEGILSQRVWELVRQHACTSLAGVPYTYHMLRRLNLDRLDVPTIRTCTQAGGKLEDDHIAHFHHLMAARGGRFFVMYGQTEASPRIAVLPSGRLPEKLGSAGLPLTGGTFTIQCDEVNEGTPERVGELLYQGPNVMMGYAMSRADLCKGDELHGRLHTGDTAYLDAEGYVYLLGRAGRETKLFGLRINLDEVESMLRSYGPTAVTAGPDQLLIFCEHGEPETYRQYARDLSQKLHLNYQAFVFRHIDKLPVTSRGKIDYQKLSGR